MKNTTKPKHSPGFIRGRGIVFLLITAIIIALVYFGTTWSREYFILKKGETCSERLWLIETAKEKYRKQTNHTTGNIQTFADILPFLAYTGFPMCPTGGEYENKLSLDHPVTCPHNGQPEYEPAHSPPGTSLMNNGYNDLGSKPKGLTLREFLTEKVDWEKKSDKEKEESKKKTEGIFKD